MKLGKLVLAAASCSLFVMTVNAGHTWNRYHWATTDGIVHLPSVNKVTSDWITSYKTSLDKWEISAHIDHSTRENGDSSASSRETCSPTLGKIVTCNYSYGNNGWAGLASINLDRKRHITQGVAKMNDYYMVNDPVDYRNHVMCQEIGHLYGLGHTSENGSSQQTCMDYSDDINSQWPNGHDYDTLASIYNHFDNYATAAGTTTEPPTEPPADCKGGWKKCGGEKPTSGQARDFGIKVSQSGKSQIWVAPGEGGTLWVTHITLAEGYDDIVHDDAH